MADEHCMPGDAPAPASEWTRERLLAHLVAHGITYTEATHAPVHTMAESAELGLVLPGSRCKNLLVQDKKGLHRFVVVTEAGASVDLALLGRALGVGRLSLSPPEVLRELLHVAPGALSPLALVGDAGAEGVRLVMDESLRITPHFLFHPLVNTSTLSLSSQDLRRFLATTGHRPEYLSMPLRQPAATLTAST